MKSLQIYIILLIINTCDLQHMNNNVTISTSISLLQLWLKLQSLIIFHDMSNLCGH